MAKWSYVILGLILCLPILGWIGIVSYKSVVFNQEIGGHMERASNANTVPLALEEMQLVVANMEKNEYTSGYTSILYRTPDEDVGFWYTNMKESLSELNRVNPNATQLEQSNVLMKLRETLTSNSKDGSEVTVPSGISRFPNNAGYAIFFWIAAILLIVGVIAIIYGADSRY